MLVLDYFLKASWLPKTEQKSKTSKKWKKLIFAHADFDDTSNEIRRGLKFQAQNSTKAPPNKVADHYRVQDKSGV